MREIDEVKPYLKESDSNMEVIFKTGFFSCIKAVEDMGHEILVIHLKDLLKKCNRFPFGQIYYSFRKIKRFSRS